MFKAAKMSKVRIYALRSALPELISALHREGILEIQKGEFKGLDEGRPLEFFSVVSEQLVRMRAINAMLEKYAAAKRAGKRSLISGNDAVRQARELKIEERLKSLVAEAGAKESEMSRLKSQMAQIDKVLPFTGVDFSKLETRTVSYRVGDIPPEKVQSLKKTLDKEFGTEYNIVQPAGGKTCLLLFKKGEYSPDQAMANAGFQQMELPPGTTTPAQSRRALETSYNEAGARLKEIRAELGRISEEHLSHVRDLIFSLGIESERAEISSRFGFSKSMAVFEGWVVAKDAEKISHVVGKFGERASMSVVEFSHHEEPPVVLDNPKVASPFEFITKSYSLPNYFELDPTMIYMVGIPILLGMIVGDVVYGIVTIFLGMFLMKKFKDSYTMSNVSAIWFYTGFTTIVFGLIFDEWGGFHNGELMELLREWGLPAPEHAIYTGFSRLHELSLLIGITIIVGLVHLGLGFLLGAYNEWGHNKKHAAAKFCWIGVEIGGTLAVCAMVLKILPAAYGMPSLGLLGLSVIGIALTEGIVGILEVPGLMGNALSYARIAAIGVVGVVLAEIINEFFAPKPDMGLFLIVAIPLFLIFHFVNLFIAIFEALIQGGRLNLIEFRSKFLRGGGREFAPFALRAEAKQLEKTEVK